MPRFKPKGILERDAVADLWKRTLSQIPTLLGRLVYLASLRDSITGIYRHHGLAAGFGRDESARALRQSHEETFAQWLAQPLPEKSASLISYLSGLEEPMVEVVIHWLRSSHYQTFVPDSARKSDRDRFGLEVETLLTILRNEMTTNAPVAARPVPGSGQPG
jgi:hypothetical protein